MEALTYPEFSKHLTELLKKVELGEEIIIQHEETRENIAVLIPYKKYQEEHKNTLNKTDRKLGILKKTAGYKIKKNFKITDEELLNS
ncbi:MAG: type II toxin-antitoxin system prevent-host-death family antitoxin [Balneolaceae bacterium]|nr:type II toxin-antitoxin system prevent-host-death family antitoxin [Balneolaceae bacterium]